MLEEHLVFEHDQLCRELCSTELLSDAEYSVQWFRWMDSAANVWKGNMHVARELSANVSSTELS